jgi:hypothetical protein
MSVPVALRASTPAALVVLLLQYGLGIRANLYATLPAFAAAITKGPDIRRLPKCAGMSLEYFPPRVRGGYVSGAPCSSWRAYSFWS